MPRTYPEPIIPRPPPLRPTWTTWMWLSFAVAVAVATGIGLWLANKPFWH
jgi:hypothetical protein